MLATSRVLNEGDSAIVLWGIIIKVNESLFQSEEVGAVPTYPSHSQLPSTAIEGRRNVDNDGQNVIPSIFRR